MTEKNPYISWDSTEIYCEVLEKSSSDGGWTDEQIISETQFLTDICWRDLIDDLSEVMDEISPIYSYWNLVGSGVTWRRVSCTAHIRAGDGEELLRKILPRGECRFYIYKEEGAIVIHVWHHDCPVDPEEYRITPASDRDQELYEYN